MMTRLPLSPKILSSSMERRAFLASWRVWAMMTPLPRARPSALMTVGMGASSMYASASFRSVNTA